MASERSARSRPGNWPSYSACSRDYSSELIPEWECSGRTANSSGLKDPALSAAPITGESPLASAGVDSLREILSRRCRLMAAAPEIPASAPPPQYRSPRYRGRRSSHGKPARAARKWRCVRRIMGQYLNTPNLKEAAMKFLATSSDLRRSLRDAMRQYQCYRLCVAWASRSFPLCDDLLKRQDRISQLVVGTWTM